MAQQKKKVVSKQAAAKKSAQKTVSLSQLPKMKAADLSPDDMFMVTDVTSGGGAKYVSKGLLYGTLSAEVEKQVEPGIKKKVVQQIRPEISSAVEKQVPGITERVTSQVSSDLSVMVREQVSADVPIERWYDEGSDTIEAAGFILSGGNSLS